MIFLFNCSDISQMLSGFLISPFSSSSYILCKGILTKTHIRLLPHCQLNLSYMFCSRYQVPAVLLSLLFHSDLLHYPLPTYFMSRWMLAINNFLSIIFSPSSFFACVPVIFSLGNTQISILSPRIILNPRNLLQKKVFGKDYWCSPMSSAPFFPGHTETLYSPAFCS